MLFSSPLVEIGEFRAHPGHPRFHDAGEIDTHLFVFPRTAVVIRHEGGEPFVAGPNVVTLYNRGQLYRRDRISPVGDHCTWFAPRPDVLLDAARRLDPGVEERPERPFPSARTRSDPRCYLEQRRLTEVLRSGGPADRLRVEETALELLEIVLGTAYGEREQPGRAALARALARRELARAAEVELSREFRRDVGLDELARRLGSSPGHLCRVFRRVVGARLHRYRDALRLRASLEEIAAGGDLTELALDLGYSSHSHFTASFRRHFGETPSEFRRSLAGGGSRAACRANDVARRAAGRRRSGI